MLRPHAPADGDDQHAAPRIAAGLRRDRRRARRAGGLRVGDDAAERIDARCGDRSRSAHALRWPFAANACTPGRATIGVLIALAVLLAMSVSAPDRPPEPRDGCAASRRRTLGWRRRWPESSCAARSRPRSARALRRLSRCGVRQSLIALRRAERRRRSQERERTRPMHRIRLRRAAQRLDGAEHRAQAARADAVRRAAAPPVRPRRVSTWRRRMSPSGGCRSTGLAQRYRTSLSPGAV